VGILTSQNADTPEGLESHLSVEICRILTEIPHSTELELGNLHAQATLRTRDKPGSPPALRTMPLSLLYRNELGSTIGG
jgi:hypothetical protein